MLLFEHLFGVCFPSLGTAHPIVGVATLAGPGHIPWPLQLLGCSPPQWAWLETTHPQISPLGNLRLLGHYLGITSFLKRDPKRQMLPSRITISWNGLGIPCRLLCGYIGQTIPWVSFGRAPFQSPKFCWSRIIGVLSQQPHGAYGQVDSTRWQRWDGRKHVCVQIPVIKSSVSC